MNPIIYFLTLLIFWLVWSGFLDGFHISLGIVSCAIIYLWSKDTMVSKKASSTSDWLKQFVAFELYSFWLVKEIIIANLQVFKLAFYPSVLTQLKPQLIDFKSKVSSEMGQFILAQSITLTPGTVTIRIDDGKFLIHALTEEAADALPGEMQERVSQIFNGEQK